MVNLSITTARTALVLAAPADAELLLAYQRENRDHLAPWEPERNDDYFTLEQCRSRLAQQQQQFQQGNAVHFMALNAQRTEVIGLCAFTAIVGGVFQACYLGYSLAERYQGQGYMQEILTATIDFMFTERGLHRIMANYIPSNHRSALLLERLGFEREGLARDYLHIAGQWQDHVLTAKINPLT